MCGRISLFADVETIASRFEVAVDTSVPRRYNVAPGDWLTVVTGDRPATLSRLTWGLVPHWADEPDSGPRPINARRETVDEAAPFRDPYRHRRCLVIIDGYYEWAKTPYGKEPYRFERRDREPFALAGVWDHWETDDESLETVAILTADAVDSVADVHDRMPVILSPEHERRWLNQAPADPTTHELDPAWTDSFHHYQIGVRINDPTNDDPTVIEPFNGDQQPTLTDF